MSKFGGLALEVERPQRMFITSPVTGDPLETEDGEPAYIDVYSSDSEVARKCRRRLTQARVDRAAKSGRPRMDVKQMEAEEVEFLASITAGWRLVALDGSVIDVECNVENARDLYADPATAWLFDQVNAFAGNRENFGKASLKT